MILYTFKKGIPATPDDWLFPLSKDIANPSPSLEYFFPIDRFFEGIPVTPDEWLFPLSKDIANPFTVAGFSFFN